MIFESVLRCEYVFIIEKIKKNNFLLVGNKKHKGGQIRMKTINLIAFIILVIGGLNWLTLGLFNADLVAMIAGSQIAALAKIVYILVGISALWLIFSAIYSRAIYFTQDRE